MTNKAIETLKAEIKNKEYLRDNLSQPRFMIEEMDLQIEGLNETIRILKEAEAKKKGPRKWEWLIFLTMIAIFLAGTYFLLRGAIELINLIF